MKVVWLILALSLVGCVSTDHGFSDNVSYRALKMDQHRHGKAHIIGRWDSDTGWHGYGQHCQENRR